MEDSFYEKLFDKYSYEFAPRNKELGPPPEEVCDHLYGNYSGVISCTRCGLVKTCGEVEQMKYEPDSSSWDASNPYSGGASISTQSGNGFSKTASYGQGILSSRDYRLFDKIKTYCSDFFPTAYIYKTLEIFNNISREIGDSRKSNRDGILAAVIFYICHQESIRNISQPFIIAKFKIPKFRFDHGSMKLSRWLEKENEKGEGKSMLFATQGDIIKMKTRELNLPPLYEKIAKRMVKRLNRSHIIIPNTSLSIAVGSLYYLCRKTGSNALRDKEETCGVSKATLDKVYRNLLRYERVLLSDREKKELLTWRKKTLNSKL